nr:MAG TPA: hypothetical protein [Caudoviricetes sp.]
MGLFFILTHFGISQRIRAHLTQSSTFRLKLSRKDV